MVEGSEYKQHCFHLEIPFPEKKIEGHIFLLINFNKKNDTELQIIFKSKPVITPYFWKWWVFAYFLCTVVLSTSEKIAYMYTFKIMFDTSVIQ